jgi:tetratricopeptide (TPR) repeat protein
MGRHHDSRLDSEIQATTLGQRIRHARRALGLTQEALGHPDFTKGFISLLEHDRAKPSVVSLERLAARLGRPISYFLDGGSGPLSAHLPDVLRTRGRAELARRSFEAGLATFEAMLRGTAEQHDPAAHLDALLGAGEALAGLNRIDEAWAKLQEAHERGQRLGAARVASRAAYHLADIELRRGRYPQALALSSVALDASRALGPGESMARGEIQLQLAAALSRMGRLEEAAQAYREARASLEAASQPNRLGESLYARGEALQNDGDCMGALRQFERAQSLFEYDQAVRNLSRLLDQAGAVLVQIGRPAEAIEHFTASLPLKERLRDVQGECRLLTEFARCLTASGEPAKAKVLAERAVLRSREAGLPDEEARAQALLGMLAAEAGDLREAQRALTSAARYCEDAGMRLELVPIYKELARVAGLAGRYKDASGFHERAFRLLQSLRPSEIATAVQSAVQSVDATISADASADHESPPGDH